MPRVKNTPRKTEQTARRGQPRTQKAITTYTSTRKRPNREPQGSPAKKQKRVETQDSKAEDITSQRNATARNKAGPPQKQSSKQKKENTEPRAPLTRSRSRQQTLDTISSTEEDPPEARAEKQGVIPNEHKGKQPLREGGRGARRKRVGKKGMSTRGKRVVVNEGQSGGSSEEPSGVERRRGGRQKPSVVADVKPRVSTRRQPKRVSFLTEGRGPVSSDSERQSEGEMADGRGRKRRRAGSDTQTQSSSHSRRAAGEDTSGSESEGERRRASVQEVRVAGSTVARWQPLSEGTSKVLSDAMLGALGHCLEGLSRAQKRRAEQEVEQLVNRVKQQLKSMTAPKIGRMRSYSGLKQKVAELKDMCLDLVNRNQELEGRLEEREKNIEELGERVGQLAEAASSTSSLPLVRDMEDLDGPLLDEWSDEAAVDHVADFVEKSRLLSCRTVSTAELHYSIV